MVPVLVALGFLLRVAFLEADPVYRGWAGYLTDEGRWTEVAREWALFRELDIGNSLRLMHIIVAPLFQGLTAVSFEVFGVGFASARIVSALFGIALLIAAVTFVRGRLDSAAVLFVALGFAFQPDLVFYSRVAIPEMASMFCEFLAFALILSADRRSRRALAAGLCTAIALGMKATVFPVFFVFGAVLFVNDRAEPGKVRLMRLSAFAMGVAVPALVVLTTGLVAVGGGGGGDTMGGTLGVLTDFVYPSDLYGALTRLFNARYAPALNVLLAPAWAIGGLLLVLGKRPSGPDWSLYVGTAIWVCAWITVASVLAYFPDRYALHVLVPLILNIGAGVSLLQRSWASGERPEPVTGARPWRLFVAAWWALPAAVVFAPILLGLISNFVDIGADRFTSQLGAIGVGELALVLGLTGPWSSDRRGWLTVLITPLASVPLLAGALEIDLIQGFWTSGQGDTLGKFAILVGSFSIAAVTSRRLSGTRSLRVAAYAYLVPLCALWIGLLAPRLVTRTYIIRDTSTLVGELAGDRDFVETLTAGSLFLGNDLMYREVSLDAFQSSSPPEFAVVFLSLATMSTEGYETLALVNLRVGDLVQPIDTRLLILRRRQPD